MLSCLVSFNVLAADVLVLHSEYQGDQETRQIQKGIEHAFTDSNIALYVSYLDSNQLMSDQALTRQVDFLSRKYDIKSFDAIIVSGEHALQLVRQYGQRLFADIPVIFTGTQLKSPQLSQFSHAISAVVEPENILDTVSLGLKLFPNTIDVYIVTGNEISSQLTDHDKRGLLEYDQQSFIILNNENEASLKKTISQSPSNGLLVFSDFSKDNSGSAVNRDEVLKSLTAIARIPLLVIHQHDLIEGVLGGVVTSGFSQGEAAGAKVLKLLQGVPLEDLPAELSLTNKHLIQYTELLRWGLKGTDLPNGYEIINEPSLETETDFRTMILFFMLSVLSLIIILIWRKYSHLSTSNTSLKAQHERVNNIFNVSYDFIFILDLVGEIKMANQTALDFINMHENDINGEILWETPWWQHDAASKKKLKSAMGQARVGKTARFECRLIDKNHQSNAFDVFIQPVKNERSVNNPRHEITSIIVEARDISSIKAVEEEIQKANKRSNLLLDESPSMLLMLNVQGLILSCNKFGCNLLGYGDGELVGRNLVTLYSQLVNIEDLKSYLAECADQEDMLRTREISYSTKNGRKVWINERVRKIEGHDQYFLVCENITERYELSKELNYRASHDYLTGLKNRLFFESQLDKNLDEVKQQNLPCCLMYLDMDKFKIINDTCGHHAGDEVLRQIATILTESVSARAMVARLGGDEFAIILPNTKLEEAKQAAERIIAAIAKHYFLWEGHHFSLGISIGLTELSNFFRDGVHALSCVDSACYTAKQSGRNRIHIYEEDIQEELRREEVVWVNKVQDALRDETRFCLYAQVIKPVDGDENYLHYEILTRMIDENGELAPPAKFIPIAESYNLADKIDMIIITKTLNWLKNHPEHVLQLNMCSINLSGQSLGDPQFIEDLVELLMHSSLPLEKLCFEITETVAIGNFSNASKLINSLKQLGCQLALDDFGTGLSSFGYLKRLNVDYLKIDGVFVKDMATDEQDFGIVKTIHELSHLFGKKTIAEYVENEAIIEKLNEIGVDFAQGYHLGKPMPIDMMALLSTSLTEDM
ncbi:bifunctional diguanylate cyclase/phosphodiesterase [Psychromonas sp. B3M02]|uniref:bifunctional diguanylate cyclase/phosphodiesterase n=1 Tax=Psychromonas sp. B3M02 TaxID=2267226 RepID=UPI0015F11CFC|nr:bifunctional diguanylate cyclase/phosphodiesterase [Psychromonas sp. B3M02]